MISLSFLLVSSHSNPKHPSNTPSHPKESREHMTMKSLQSRIAATPSASQTLAVSIAAPAFEVLVPATFPFAPKLMGAPRDPVESAVLVATVALGVDVTKKPCSS